MKLKRVTTLVEDFALGYEQMGGFQEVFEKYGGRPVVTPDYAPYLVQIRDRDGVCEGFAGSNPLKFMQQYAEFGFKLPICGGETAGDDALLPQFGDYAVGLITACPFTIGYDSDAKRSSRR